MRVVVAFLTLLSAAACGDGGPVGQVTVDRTAFELGAGSARTVRLSVQMLQTLDPRPQVVAQLLDEGGQLLRTFDHRFPVDWRAGQIVDYNLYLYQSVLADPLAAGRYELRLGLSDGKGKRLALKAGGAEVLVPARARTPAFGFSTDWDPIQAGAGQRVLPWRPVPQRGTIVVSSVPVPGHVWLQFQLDTPGSAVHLRADCTGFERDLATSGPHLLQIPIEGPCGLVVAATGTVRLDVLAWAAGPA